MAQPERHPSYRRVPKPQIDKRTLLKRSAPRGNPNPPQEEENDAFKRPAPRPKVDQRESSNNLGYKVMVGDQEVPSDYCHHCEIMFIDPIIFLLHKAAHGRRNPFACNHCGHVSHDKNAFYAHLSANNHHQSE